MSGLTAARARTSFLRRLEQTAETAEATIILFKETSLRSFSTRNFALYHSSATTRCFYHLEDMEDVEIYSSHVSDAIGGK